MTSVKPMFTLIMKVSGRDMYIKITTECTYLIFFLGNYIMLHCMMLWF